MSAATSAPLMRIEGVTRRFGGLVAVDNVSFEVRPGQIVGLIGPNVAGKTIRKRYDLSKPQGVRGRNSDNTRLREVLKWEPAISLEEGLDRTYHWIAQQVSATPKNKPLSAGS